MVNKRAIILLALVAVIVVFPLALYNGKGEGSGLFWRVLMIKAQHI